MGSEWQSHKTKGYTSIQATWEQAVGAGGCRASLAIRVSTIHRV